METPRKDMDSKVSRSFLRMVLKELGKPVPEELQINSWEMFDLIVKNIHLIRDELKRREKVIHDLSKLADENNQLWLIDSDFGSFDRKKAVRDAVKEFYEKKK